MSDLIPKPEDMPFIAWLLQFDGIELTEEKQWREVLKITRHGRNYGLGPKKFLALKSRKLPHV